MERDRLKCFLQDLAADLADPTVPLSHGDELIRRDHAEIGVLPTRKHLKAVKLARCENHQGLEMREKFPALQGTAHVPQIRLVCETHNQFTSAELELRQIRRSTRPEMHTDNTPGFGSPWYHRRCDNRLSGTAYASVTTCALPNTVPTGPWEGLPLCL